MVVVERDEGRSDGTITSEGLRNSRTLEVKGKKLVDLMRAVKMQQKKVINVYRRKN